MRILKYLLDVRVRVLGERIDCFQVACRTDRHSQRRRDVLKTKSNVDLPVIAIAGKDEELE